MGIEESRKVSAVSTGDLSEPHQVRLEFAEFDSVPPVGSEGGEDEQDLQSHDPENFRGAVSSTDWTVETLVNQLRKGRIDLDPYFQRRNAWLDQRKSQLIESIMLRYPIPQIVLAEKRDAPGTYIVIDGKQRLLALRQFCVDPADKRDAGFESLKLRGLEILAELNGSNWTAVQGARPDLAATFENHTIRTVLLSNWSSEDLLLSIFLRLNTGSVVLSPQELRQALHPGKFSEWIDARSSNSRGLQRMLGLRQADRRMIDAELLLRFVSLRLSPLAYRSNLKKFLDESSGEFTEHWQAWQVTLDSAVVDLEAAISAGLEIFADDTFCRKWNGDRWERPFNRALFDIQAMSLADLKVRTACMSRSDDVVDAFKTLCESDPDFIRSITVTTKTATAFRVRFEGWRGIVKNVTGETFELPKCLYMPAST